MVTPGAVNFISATPSISGLTGNGSVVLGNASTSGATNLALNISGTTTISTAIAEASPGLGSVSKTGPGSLTLTGNNTYSGGTIISAGNLVANTSSLGTGSLHLNGGTFSPPAASLGLVANYYGPNIANFNSITSPSLANFNSTYVAGQTLAVSNNISANVVNGVSGKFDFDTIGEGALFPAPFNYGAPLNAGGTVAGTQVNNWAASYTGYFYAPTTGTYTFATNSDDNSRLWINNVDTAVVANGTSTGGQGWAGYGIVGATGTVNLTAGQLYPITVGYDEGSGGFGLEAFVALPGSTLTAGQAGTFIPLSNLYGGAPNYSNPLLVDNGSTLALSLLPGGVSFPYTFPSLTIGANGAASLHVTGSGTSLLIAGATTLSGPSTFMLDAGVSVTLPQVSGPSGFTLSGNGLLNLTSATGNTYTGNTTVSGGTVSIANTSGSAFGTGNVVVNGGVVSGTGIIGNNVTVSTGGVLAPAPGPASFGTLTINGNATLANGAGLAINVTALGGSSNDMVAVNGNLSLSGSVLVTPSYPNGLLIGTFPFLTYTGNLTNTATFEFPSGALNYTLVPPGAGNPNEFEFTTSYNNATWSGGTNGNWDTTTTGNWTQGTPYVNGNPGQPAIFPDITGTSAVVVQAAGVAPATVTFTNNSTSYSFSNAGSGTAGISGVATTVTLSGSGTVAFNSPNTYGGGTFLNAGKLIVAADNALGAAPASPTANLTFNGGALSFAGTTNPTLNVNRSIVLNGNGGTLDVSQAANTVTVPGQISGVGGLAKTGPGTVSLTGSNTYQGGTTIDAGTLVQGSQTALGTGTITLNGGVLQLQQGVPTSPPVPGYSYWFNAANLGLANGAQVTTLANSGSVGGSATAVSSSPPTYLTNAVNGLGAVLFSGQQGLLWPAQDSNIETVFSIFKGSSFLMTDSSNPGSGNYNFHRYQGDDNDANAPLWDIQTSNGWASGNITGGTTSVNGSIYYQNNASTIADMPVNASTNGFNLIAVQTTGAVTADSFNYDRGSPGNPGDHYAGNGGSGTQEQGEVIVYNSQLTTAQVQEVESYLNTKWNLGIAGLPPSAGSYSNAVNVTAPSTINLYSAPASFGSLSLSSTLHVTGGPTASPSPRRPSPIRRPSTCRDPTW